MLQTMQQFLLLFLFGLVARSYARNDGSWFDPTGETSLHSDTEDLIKQSLQNHLAYAKEEILNLKNDAVEEIQKVREEAQREIQKVKTEAREDIEKVRLEAKQEIQKVKDEAEEELKKVKEEAEEDIQKVKDEAELLKLRLKYFQSIDDQNTKTNVDDTSRVKRSMSVTENIGAASFSVMEQLVKLMAPISCYQWRQYGFNISGQYLIDPDGKGVGEPPFTVHCDMLTGYTFVSHDSEDNLQADSCSGDRCYTKEIRYAATERQIQSLMLVSDSCQQYIKIDCFNSPLQKDDNSLAFWMDRHGKYHDFWAGSSGNHTCSCGLSESCIDPRKSCHCDADMDGQWLKDDGYLSDMLLLPVQRLTFGSSESETLQMNHTVGPLRCFPSPPVDAPCSCHDLLLSGARTSGYFFLKEEDSVYLTYCNFPEIYLNRKTEDNAEKKRVQLKGVAELEELMEKELESIRNQLEGKLKVQFVAEASFKKAKNERYLKYTAFENKGAGYDNSTGLFTAPIAGVYYFSVSLSTEAKLIPVKVSIEKNFNEVAVYTARYRKNNDNLFVQLLELQVGDWVGIRLKRGRARKHTGSTFKGMLLYEI